MKKLLLLMLGLTLCVSGFAGTKTTVYYAVPSSVVGSYTVKINVQLGNGSTEWHSAVMTNTGLTYEGKTIYSDSFEDLYNGVQKIQFQLYDGDNWKSEQAPIDGTYWTTPEYYNGKMYIHDNSYVWSDFSATYTRDNLAADKYGTICLPFSGTVSGATLYEITSKIMDGENLKGININSVGTSLTAGQAYIFKASGSELTVSLSGSYTDAATGGAIVGNYTSSLAVETGKYIIKDNKLWDAGTGVTIGQYRAYIDLSGVSAAARGANSIYFGDDATGIESIQNENNENVMFNLQGQRVNNAQKGLVIVGGKKMLRK